MVDVTSEIEIRRPRAEVAAYACDPDNIRSWYENIKAVGVRCEPPHDRGWRLAFLARVRGRPHE